MGGEAGVVWIPRTVWHLCRDEASTAFPLETGGTFMGWRMDDLALVVTAVIGPGPNAEHGKHHFQPDQEWQLKRIAEHYEDTGRRETYLGDWHSHPNASLGILSRSDRRVLRRVAAAPSARCPRPLMLLLAGGPGDWSVATWIARLHRRPFLWPTLIVARAEIQIRP
jgi:integrative and conjugative element protein (TIGR02256 family)